MNAERLRNATLCLCLLSLNLTTACLGAEPDRQAAEPVRALEDLNLKGGTADNPPFTDTWLGADSDLRKEMFRHGLLFRMGANGAYIQNMLAAPVSEDAVSYTGQRPYVGGSLNPVLTWDLRQLGLWNTQLNINGQLQKANWTPAQPASATISTVYVYHEFGEDRAELKFGYLTTDFQFIGLQVGGQVASGAQGVYAVLPYEVGLSYGALGAPTVTLKVRGPQGFYGKGAVQRAGEPGSEDAALRRDALGLRFLPKGDKLVLVGELGHRQNVSAGTMQHWYRAGYITNSTPYTSLKTGEKKSGNYCAYVLGDRQLWQPDEAQAGRGIYGGVSAMVVPADLDTYRLYYEARVYSPAPLRSRPGDFASVVASYTAISQDTLRTLAAEGKTFSRASDSVTGSYMLRLARGTYAGLGLSYVNGPSVTPKTAAALTFTAQTSIFF
ncbi:MAG: carbohydrate porin [Terracidiphilus sp.]|nr:carbohydrate porin [Terracidiphilus sp.]